MTPILQFVNQYSFLLVCAAGLIAAAVYLRRRQAARGGWGVWGMVAVANVGVVMMLPTPAVRLSDGEPGRETAGDFGSAGDAASQGFVNTWGPESISEIKAILAEGKRPTLVEFYSDFGLG